MENIKIEIPQWVQDLLGDVTLNTKGYDVYLGGGLLRDSYCDLPFKDIDIFLVPNGEDKQLVPYTPKGYGISYTKDCEDNDDMSKRGVGALIGMYDRNKASKEVQYIIYDKPMTQEELVDDMDIGINQVMWKHGEDLCMASDDFVIDHNIEYITFYHEYNPKRMWSRLQRMIIKFPEYYYEEDECNLTLDDKLELQEEGTREFEGSA
jgi:hypothetical protein